MDEYQAFNLDYFPENILIDVLSYLSIRELIKAGRVCKRWNRLVKDQRLWRFVDLTAWKGVTSRILWLLLRHYLGRGLRCLRLRGLLLYARGGTFLSESWLRALPTKCPRLNKLYLVQADLRSLHSCQLLPPSLQVLELRGCELPLEFFNQTSPSQERAEATSSVGGQQQGRHRKGKGLGSPSGIGIERLVLNNVPSFTDHHLKSLTSWERLSRLKLRDTFRVTANGIMKCAAKDGLSRLKFLEISIHGRRGYPLQFASLGLSAGWLGLEELCLGGKEVRIGLLNFNVSRLENLKCLCLRACKLHEMQIVRNCRLLSRLSRLEFLHVTFQQIPPAVEGEGGGSGEEQDNEEAAGVDDSNDENNTVDMNDPIPSLCRSLADLLPTCTLVFTNCSVQISAYYR
ncbi:hypothetical protein VZT92_010242 [Zoarces viviparus]|uniref:F-box domain-containing protein n=1 Tax=Zoarces viviparus TaxID=48416 RepID=A0AAW1FF96_ZOAVI